MGWGNVSQNGERVLYHNGDTLDSHSEMFITNSYYLVIDSVLALIFALVLASFLRLPYWYKRFEQRSRYRLVRVSFRLLGKLLLPTLILLGLPALGGYSWPFILRAVPDLGWWILVTMSLSLITGMLRGVLVLRALRQKNVPLKGVPIP